MIEPLRQLPEEGLALVREEARTRLSGFVEFIRDRGVTGLAIGFVLGTSVQKLVTSFVTDIASPAVSIVAGRTDRIEAFQIGPFLVGNFLANLFDFLLLVLIIYLVFSYLKLDKLDKPKT